MSFRTHGCYFNDFVRAIPLSGFSTLAFSPAVSASYAIPVRQASGLPSASFRFRFATEPLPFGLLGPPAADLHRQVNKPLPRVAGIAPFRTVRAMNGAPRRR